MPNTREDTIRQVAEELLQQSNPVLTYSEVLEEVRQQHPEANTTRSSLRWYAARMRKDGAHLPTRPLDVPKRRTGTERSSD
jgi:Asp-tRNA(Asn)/Glu-tRNA(Gln) amidotransferase C subunit